MAIYELPLLSSDYDELRDLLDKPKLLIGAAESIAAEEYWNRNHTTNGMLFFDLEQIAIEAAGFDIGLSKTKHVWGRWISAFLGRSGADIRKVRSCTLS